MLASEVYSRVLQKLLNLQSVPTSSEPGTGHVVTRLGLLQTRQTVVGGLNNHGTLEASRDCIWVEIIEISGLSGLRGWLAKVDQAQRLRELPFLLRLDRFSLLRLVMRYVAMIHTWNSLKQ